MTEPANGDQCLLDYAIISEPFPLYAAAPGADPEPATVHIVVSNGTGTTVYCREILFSLPHGDLAQSLIRTLAKDGDQSGTDGWTVGRLQDGVAIAVPQGDYEHFIAKAPEGGGKLDVSGITITFDNLTISDKPGTARVEVRETATLDQGQWPESPRFVALPITKFPAPAPTARDVYDFHAEKAEVNAGDEVHLKWRGPKKGVAYTVVHGGTSEKPTTDLEWKGKITRDTTFRLEYTVGDATHYLTTTVMVANPQLTGLVVDNDAEIHGNLTVGKDTTVTGALEATDDITTSAQFLDPKGTPLRGMLQ
ncbi:hypothetical protein [Streptomyces hiroshimensis]|uniref:Uncharacterized protein n=1 Tax=Streptomyces hiroshimensis TaxID=66424 RepID=A0ABQ2Y876_9ACTN|nr:hypothetical protein [Streptomyces hiroshimensis]GGX74011.1 hypothetical protein GCM10010324_19190 [Streptomyces hiroshimensis]